MGDGASRRPARQGRTWGTRGALGTAAAVIFAAATWLLPLARAGGGPPEGAGEGGAAPGAAPEAAAAQDGARSARELRRELAELTERMADKDPAKRRVGVKRLAELGGREAWELVIAALYDPEPEVADEAQLQLARLDDERLLARVLDRDGLRGRDALVALRVAEAFGRMPGPVDGAALLARMRRGEPAVGRTLVWSIERLAERGGLGGDLGSVARELARLAGGGGDPELRGAALLALAALQGAGARASIEGALRDRAPALRVAGLAALRRIDDDALALAQALRLAADRDRAVRHQAVLELERLGTRETLEALIERLEVEDRPRLRLRVLEALQRLSGMRYRLDARSWRHWASSLPEDWRPARVDPPEAPGGTVAFAGLPILSDRLALLMDFSGSLWNKRPDGTTRKDVLDGKVREVLERLPPETEFDLVPFTAVPHPWQGRIVPARRKTVEEAIRWFEACRERGKGNAFDAIVLALEDVRVDTLVVLTDGAPTGGHRWNLELMVPLLVEATRFRHIAFDCVLVDAPPGLRRHWERLSRLTGGRAVAIEM